MIAGLATGGCRTGIGLGGSDGDTVIVALVGAAFAADVGMGANLVGMGGVGAAASEDNAAITLNPGLIALHPRFDFGGLFRYGPKSGLQWGGHAMDARQNEHFALGVTYTGDRFDPPITTDELPGWIEPGTEVANRKRLHDVTAAIGVPLANRLLAVGIGANVGWFDNDRQGSGTLFDLDAGIGLKPVKALTFGAAGRNLLPIGPLDRDASLLTGARVEDASNIAFEANAEWMPLEGKDGWFFAAGAEKALGPARIQAGWQRAMNDGHGLSLGVGVVEDGAALEYGVLVPVTGPLAFARTVHTFSVRFSAPPPIPDM